MARIQSSLCVAAHHQEMHLIVVQICSHNEAPPKGSVCIEPRQEHVTSEKPGDGIGNQLRKAVLRQAAGRNSCGRYFAGKRAGDRGEKALRQRNVLAKQRSAMVRSGKA